MHDTRVPNRHIGSEHHVVRTTSLLILGPKSPLSRFCPALSPCHTLGVLILLASPYLSRRHEVFIVSHEDLFCLMGTLPSHHNLDCVSRREDGRLPHKAWQSDGSHISALEILRGVILDWLGWTTGTLRFCIFSKQDGRWNLTGLLMIVIALTEKRSGYTECSTTYAAYIILHIT